MKEKNYWLETATIPCADPSRAFPDRVDVAVIGSGVTGLSAARILAKRGINTAVLEAETFGWGASSRNGGMVLTGLKLPVPTLISRYGRERARRMYAASLVSIDCVEQIVREEKIECDFSRCGHLEVACKQAHFDSYAESAELIEKEFNHKLRIVPKAALREEIGSDIYYGGLVDETSAGTEPGPLCRGTGSRGSARRRRDVRPYTRNECAPERQQWLQRFHLSTSRGSLAAREVFWPAAAISPRRLLRCERRSFQLVPTLL